MSRTREIEELKAGLIFSFQGLTREKLDLLESLVREDERDNGLDFDGDNEED